MNNNNQLNQNNESQINNNINNTANYNLNNNQGNYVNNLQNENINRETLSNNVNNNQNYYTNGIFNNNQKKNNSKKIIIIALTVVVSLLIIFGLTKVLGGNSSSGNGYTADANEVLKINEPNRKFYIKVLGNPEKHTIANSYLFDGNYIRLKVEIENPTTSELEFNLYDDFKLVDSSKNVIATSNSFFTDDDSIFGKTITSGEKTEGYLYFYNYLDENTGEYTTDYNQMNDIKYVKISVISETKTTSDGHTVGNAEDYYIEFK